MGKNKAASSSEKSALGDWGTPPKLMESVERVSALFINFVFGYPNTMLAKRKAELGESLFLPNGVQGKSWVSPARFWNKSGKTNKK
ncbi:hypothetical protein ACFO26_07340 [Lactococcus nasutitermitis]|uniref:Uncharacterized protein n=1 Tax=Lactococcus nasutitermitis TaxID=1652957 RepID=A0ABV9JH49_9LACT|nr:hypothetical protein [Lactococcus nasutitermitis]